MPSQIDFCAKSYYFLLLKTKSSTNKKVLKVSRCKRRQNSLSTYSEVSENSNIVFSFKDLRKRSQYGLLSQSDNQNTKELETLNSVRASLM